jgi:hypothetical protein
MLSRSNGLRVARLTTSPEPFNISLMYIFSLAYSKIPRARSLSRSTSTSMSLSLSRLHARPNRRPRHGTRPAAATRFHEFARCRERWPVCRSFFYAQKEAAPGPNPGAADSDLEQPTSLPAPRASVHRSSVWAADWGRRHATLARCRCSHRKQIPGRRTAFRPSSAGPSGSPSLGPG